MEGGIKGKRGRRQWSGGGVKGKRGRRQWRGGGNEGGMNRGVRNEKWCSLWKRWRG